MYIKQVITTIKKDIFAGEFGSSGARFLNINGVMGRYNISYVSAIKIINLLVNDCTLLQIGKRNFIANGPADTKSDIYKLLHSQKRKKIGLLTKTLNPFFSTIIEEICKILEENSIDVIIKFCEEDTIIDTIKTLVGEGCCALINFCFFFENKAFNEFVNRLPIPMIFVGQTPTSNNPAILSDNYYAGYRAGKHLIEYGYEEFYFVSQDVNTYNERLKGFQEAIVENDFEFNDSHKITFDDEMALRQIHSIVESTSRRVGIFCMHDIIGYNVLNGLLAKNVAIPQKVGIIGYDKLETGFNQIKLTSLYYSLSEMAQTTCEVLVDYILHPLKPPKVIKLHSALFVRDTTQKLG